jgi:hypothetical protein
MKRSKVAFVVAAKPEFNLLALKYFLLSLNKVQHSYEFTFPDFVDAPSFEGHFTTEAILNDFFQIVLKSGEKPDYWILITKASLEGNYFSVSTGNISIITTFGWQKYFSPPSLFEYLLNSSVACLLNMHPRLHLSFHSETRGCPLDYTRLKSEDRVDIAMGYICDADRDRITKSLGKSALLDYESMLNRKWIGAIAELHSVAYDLKRYFKFDIEKDSGLKKSVVEKMLDTLYDVPAKVLVLIAGAIVTAIAAILFGVKK